VAAQQANPGSWWHTLKQLLEIRKGHPAFGEGSTIFLDPHNPAVMAVVRVGNAETLLAVHNLSGSSQTCLLDLSRWQCSGLEDLFSKQSFQPVSPGRYELTLNEYGYVWARVVSR